MRSAFALRIISGRTILNFGFQESLRTFLKPIFTGGVVEENGSCSAAFCESVALRERLHLVFTALFATNALYQKNNSAIFAQSVSGGHF